MTAVTNTSFTQGAEESLQRLSKASNYLGRIYGVGTVVGVARGVTFLALGILAGVSYVVSPILKLDDAWSNRILNNFNDEMLRSLCEIINIIPIFPLAIAASNRDGYCSLSGMVFRD